MRTQPLLVNDFSQGQNSEDSDSLIPDNAVVLCKHGIIGKEGIRKRPGYQKWNSSGIASAIVSSMIRFTPSSGTDYFLAMCGTDIYQANLANKTFSSIHTGITADKLWDFIAYNDKLYMTNGADTPLSYDGTTVASVSAIPVGEYFALLKDRLFVSGVSSAPYRLYYSAVGDVETFPTDNYIDFPDAPHGNEGIITGLAALGNDLVVFKERATYLVTERVAGSFAVVQVDPFIGCVSHHSIQNIQGGIFFLSFDGVYFYDTRKPQFIGKPIKDFTDARATGQEHKAVSSYYDKCYILSFPGSGQTDNTKTCIFNTNGGWSTWPGFGFHYFSLWEDNTIYGAGDAGYVYQLWTGTNDDGNVIDFQVETKAYGDHSNRKYREFSLQLEGSQGAINLEVSIDGEAKMGTGSVAFGTTGAEFDAAQFGTAVFAQEEGGGYQRIPLNLVGRLVKAKIRANVSNDDDFKIKSICFHYRPKRRK